MFLSHRDRDNFKGSTRDDSLGISIHKKNVAAVIVNAMSSPDLSYTKVDKSKMAELASAKKAVMGGK